MPPGIVRKFFRSCGIARLRPSLKHPTGLNISPNRKKKVRFVIRPWTDLLFVPTLMRKIVHSSLSSSEGPTWNERQLYEMVSSQGTNPSRDLVHPLPFPRAFFSPLVKALITNKPSSEDREQALIIEFQTRSWCTEIRSALSRSCNRVDNVIFYYFFKLID